VFCDGADVVEVTGGREGVPMYLGEDICSRLGRSDEKNIDIEEVHRDKKFNHEKDFQY